MRIAQYYEHKIWCKPRSGLLNPISLYWESMLTAVVTIKLCCLGYLLNRCVYLEMSPNTNLSLIFDK
jgi:hypothetical protein